MELAIDFLVSTGNLAATPFTESPTPVPSRSPSPEHELQPVARVLDMDAGQDEDDDDDDEVIVVSFFDPAQHQATGTAVADSAFDFPAVASIVDDDFDSDDEDEDDEELGEVRLSFVPANQFGGVDHKIAKNYTQLSLRLTGHKLQYAYCGSLTAVDARIIIYDEETRRDIIWNAPLMLAAMYGARLLPFASFLELLDTHDDRLTLRHLLAATHEPRDEDRINAVKLVKCFGSYGTLQHVWDALKVMTKPQGSSPLAGEEHIALYSETQLRDFLIAELHLD